ncbi:MAG TPA: polysaccharide biosynthesis tyrosine autokinase [Burkholderiales bacterium]|nr:polysaccharide biosynthesis tyrosine autokinase [Burkholderiales bacterium]
MDQNAASTRREPTLGTRVASLEDRPIGRILVDMGKLKPRDVDRVFRVHREQGLRFGEAARKLRLVRDADVQYALSVQFSYPYLKPGQGALGPELVTAHEPFDAQSEVLRDLRTQMVLHWVDSERKSLVVASADPRDGRSYLAANLAVVFAQLGGKTLLIDGDMRNPRQHRIFGQGNGPGLAQVLSGRLGAEAAVRVPYFDNLWLLPAGAAPPNPLELLSSPAFPRMLLEFRGQFDLILIDTPAAARGSDARVIGARADGALVIARTDRTRAGDLERLCRTMGASGTPVVGTVLNRY